MNSEDRQGVTRGADGHLYTIPTKRADGSWRKPVRVREGYVPQDEQPAYVSATVEQRRLDRARVPGAAHLAAAPSAANSSSNSNSNNQMDGLSKAAKKNAKRREKKKAAQLEQGIASLQVDDVKNWMSPTTADQPKEMLNQSGNGDDLVNQLMKKKRNLIKKLQQIADLELKQRDGVQLNDDQRIKLTKKAELVDELDDVELDLKLAEKGQF